MSFLQKIGNALRLKTPAPANDPLSAAALKLIEEGQAAEKAGRAEEACGCYGRAVNIAPKFAKAHMNLGNALLALHFVDRALECYHTAVALEPDSAPAHYNLGNGYWHNSEFELAMRAYLAAADLDRKFVMPWVAIANMCGNLKRFNEAIDACKHAIAIDKHHAETYFLMSLIYREMGNAEEERLNLQHTLKIEPDHRTALLNLAVNVDEALDFDEGLRLGELIATKFPDVVDSQEQFIYRSSLSPDVDAAELLRRHRLAGERIEHSERARTIKHVPVNDPDKKLRIGFVSADFHNHSVSHFIEPILEHLATRDDLILLAYYNNQVVSDETKRIRSLFHLWREVGLLSDNMLADGIRSDGVDILIDLSGYTDGNRLGSLARKLAPIQASWIGYPGSTGMQAMDYYIADPYFLPKEIFAEQFVEKLVYLPSTAPYRPIETELSVNRLPALDSGRFTFASFNRPSKTHRRVISLWSRVLHAVPNSRMLLAAITSESQIDTFTRWFAEEGIAADRLIFGRRGPIDGYLRLHQTVDLCLDTFPYTGGTTTRHALWMGVPTLTMAGMTPASRQGPSILQLMGLDGFVAWSEDEFVSLAERWANSLDELDSIRLDTRDRYARSPLGKPEIVASAFAKATRIMWQRWSASQPPEHIDVSELRP